MALKLRFIKAEFCFRKEVKEHSELSLSAMFSLLDLKSFIKAAFKQDLNSANLLLSRLLGAGTKKYG